MPSQSQRNPDLELFRRASRCGERTALSVEDGHCTYSELLDQASSAAVKLLDGERSLAGRRIGILCRPGVEYVIAQWGTWMAGGISVPLAISHPEPELRHVIEDAGVDTVLLEAELRPRMERVAQQSGPRLLEIEDSPPAVERPPVVPEERALILYTSGTTGTPKGVVLTHSNLQAQVKSLVEAWGWSSRDRILNVLPLHHTHGIVNILLCALWSGAHCEFLHPFDAERVWQRLASGDLSLFMAVPTVYARLIQYWDDQDRGLQEELSRGVAGLRLMVSGSAALPVPVFEKWRRISGHRLLERYGMTEIGMALSNPLEGERRPGTVGFPLPGVEVRLSDEQGSKIRAAGISGQIEIRGANVFESYWNRPRETLEAFRESWFQTGDIAQFDEEGRYRILGRSSVDIIKTGGYKVSALEIENVLLCHPGIRECAVVGVEDPEWGERVCAAIVCSAGNPLELDEFRNWAKQKLAPYKVPSRIRLCTELPRNAMGKVTKPRVREGFLE